MMHEDTNKDYLAIAFFMSGGSFYRSFDKIKAIEGARSELVAATKRFGKWKRDALIKIHVYDVTNIENVEWNEQHVFNPQTGVPLEHLEVVEVSPHRKYKK